MSSPAAVALLQEIEQQKKNGFPEKNLVSIFVPDKYSNHRKRVSEMLMDTSWNALNENIYFIFSGAVKRIMHTRKKQQRNVKFSLLISSVGNNFSLYRISVLSNLPFGHRQAFNKLDTRI